MFQEEEITLDAEIFHGADDSFLEGFAGKARGKPCFGLTRQPGIDGGNEISASGRVISFLSEKEKVRYYLSLLWGKVKNSNSFELSRSSEDTKGRDERREWKGKNDNRYDNLCELFTKEQDKSLESMV